MTQKSPGLLITFEGTEGAGKSTLMRILGERLKGAGFRVTTTREPGGSPVAEKIRGLILGSAMDPWTELFLYEAARATHLSETLKPALDRGEVVLCDRFTDSTLAYQAEARGLPWATVRTLNKIATRGLSPDLTVWLDLDVETGLRRATERTRFENEGAEFQKKVRKGFGKARTADPKRWLRLDAGRNAPEALADSVWRRIQMLSTKRKRLANG